MNLIDKIKTSILDENEALLIIKELISGDQENKKLILTYYKNRNITSQELLVFRNYIFDKAIKVNLGDNLLDVCGTGGDGKNTFNISSLVAIVLASLGIKVAKHGNYSASSLVGSSNILESFGINFTNLEDQLKNNLHNFNLCFLHAPLFHPILKELAPIRKNLGFRTFFNLMGVLANPANPRFQVSGVSSEQDQNIVADVLASFRSDFYLVYDLNGYDEISLTGKVRIVSKSSEFFIEPEDFGVSKINPKNLVIDNPEDAKKAFLDVLEAKDQVKINVVAANAALALNLINKSDLKDSFSLVEDQIKSGKSLEYFLRLTNAHT